MKCKGKNRDDSPCNRNVSEGSEYCYQHVSGFWNKITYYLAEILGVKKRFLLWLILFSIVIFVIQMHISYQYTQILDNLKLEADAEVEISPYLYGAPFGEYFPMIITNTGDFTLENIDILVNTCEMNKYERYTLPLLPSHSERTIPFGNKETIESFKKGNCYPFAGKERSYPHFTFSPHRIMQGENYTSVSTGCGICFFNVRIMGKYRDGNQNKTFDKIIRSYMDFPVDLIVSISAKDK